MANFTCFLPEVNIKSILVSVFFCLNLLGMCSVQSQTLPAGFTRIKLTHAGALSSPVDFDFAPDGRIFIAEKSGKVRIFKNGAIVSPSFISLPTNENLERGLSGIVLDPNFSTNNFVYLYYTTKTIPIHNTLIRVTANGDVADESSKVTILDIETAESEFHHGGGMIFGWDGKLYVGVGEDHNPSHSQDLNTYKGKVLRINSDGSPAAGNPFTGSEKQKRVWTYGHRNPYALSSHPGTGKIFVAEVGEFSWEEINDVTTGGKNFGWPTAEGMSNNAAFKNPVHVYRNMKEGKDPLGEGCAITGGTFFSPVSTSYPAEYKGMYFFVDFCSGWIRYLDPANGAASKTFASGLGEGIIRIRTGPDGNLYHVGTADQQGLFKIVYSASSTPEIIQDPKSATVSQQESITFTVNATGAAPLSYIWMKDNNPITGATGASYTIPQVTAGDAGSYTVKVSNGSGFVISQPASLTVTAFNARPVATITSPGNGLTYKAGDSFNYAGTATDAEDGSLPASAFTWQIDFHHSTHIHPAGPVTGVVNGTLTIPTIGEVSAEVFFRIHLIVKDNAGLVDTTYVDLHPQKSTISLATEPAGLQVKLDGQPFTAPYSVPAVVGMTRNLTVVTPQVINTSTYEFDSWIHGGAMNNDITVSPTNTTYTAKFKNVTGIDEQPVAGDFFVKAFPNPTSGTLNIEIRLNPMEREKITLELMNVLGQAVKYKSTEDPTQYFADMLELEAGIPAGIYTLNVTVGNYKKSKRISLQR